jgi:hypothetical protein
MSISASCQNTLPHRLVSYTRCAQSHSACSNWLDSALGTLLYCFLSRKPSNAPEILYRVVLPALASSWRESSFVCANREPRIDQTMDTFARSLHHVLYDHQAGKLLISLIASFNLTLKQRSLFLGLPMKIHWLVLNQPEDLAQRNLTVPAILGTLLGRFPSCQPQLSLNQLMYYGSDFSR